MWAQEMKNLVADVRTSHRDRTAKIGQIKRESRDILKAADEYMERVAAELREAARALRDFLAENEDKRMKDFNTMMKEIQARIEEIKDNIENLLEESEERRMADFKALMKDIAGDIAEIKRGVSEVRKETKGILANYKTERKEAAGYWASLTKGKAGLKKETQEEFRCEVCGKEFGSKIALIGHMRSHK